MTYQPKQFGPSDWRVEAIMGIEECRILYSTIDQFIKEHDDIPEDHKGYLDHIHTLLFAMIAEYNLLSK
tara:strand:- start:6537 stop:6743 length:207 start_codon:yes stop_codon:yes gene_type:complete